MTPLGQRIAALIAAQGPISIAEFMTLALHERDGGYYATRDSLSADFVTAPEVSQMFGELIGLWLAQAWHDQKKPKNPRLVELGPGRGTLMRDALRALKLMPEFRNALEVVLVEVSPALRKVQAEILADCGVPLRWSESFNAESVRGPIFLIANEFFDALPVRQFIKTERGWCERMVTIGENGALAFALAPDALPAALIPADRDGAPMGGVYEQSVAGEAILEQIAHVIARDGGAGLIIDYGYDTPGFGETLQAVAGHQFADVLADPGASDLSVHVDFRALAQAARQGGASVFGPVEQGAFLTSIGIVERAEALSRNHLQIMTAQLGRLINPDQMGTLFKALAILPKGAPTPAGLE
ncbi:MAG TPA: SAM-dependent methyltransferase [Rhizomicrobium sp.]|jgi:NADH dehydrogenase [ubiquinone] 1 alpha subcomplex assembly factor 7